MGFWSMVSLVSVAGIGMVIYLAHMDHQRKLKEAELAAGRQHDADSGLDERLRKIEERIETLEIIATDKQRELNESLADLARKQE
ncbi:MAG: hypothetical protein AAGE01_21950 [Pseudomonadota bacterium]